MFDCLIVLRIGNVMIALDRQSVSVSKCFTKCLFFINDNRLLIRNKHWIPIQKNSNNQVSEKEVQILHLWL